MRAGGLAVNAMLAATLAIAASSIGASVPTLTDCLEGSDFVANAARSRDNGVERDAFIARLHDDFAAIRAFPPALRWFVRDDDDERFLAREAAAVYDRPQAPERHRDAFLRECLDRLAGGERREASPRPAGSPPDTI
jgi:hypothetical protein